jgi:beta-lactamase regulating signal transducer with metallopeptidase domain
MTLAIARYYLEAAFLLAVALGLLAAVRLIASRAPARLWVRLGYALLVAAFALPLAVRSFGPRAPFFPAPMVVQARTVGGQAQLSLAVTAAPGTAPAARITPSAIGGLALLLLLASVAGLAHLGRALVRLRRLCRALVPMRVIGRVQLCVGAEGEPPFSLWTGRSAYVVLPPAFLLDPPRLRVALAHELQHLRERDTGWAYVAALVRALLPWHPAAHHWARLLSRLQELSCDERLTRRLSPAAYGDTLVWAAERLALPGPAGAVAMLDGSASFLESRVRRIASLDRRPPRRAVALAAAACALLVLIGAAALCHGAVGDRRLSLEDARTLAARVEKATGFRVPVDETVRNELDRVLGDAGSRARFREALGRLAALRPALAPTLARHGVPAALLAIPVVESRCQVLPPASNPSRTAGLWQFIPAATLVSRKLISHYSSAVLAAILIMQAPELLD